MDPDQLAIQKPTDLDLHCFQKRICLGLGLYRLKAEWMGCVAISSESDC